MVEERGRELADADRIEAEIERMATERARWLFEREIGSRSNALRVGEGVEQRVRPKPSTSPDAAIPRPPGVDPDAGFRRARRRSSRISL